MNGEAGAPAKRRAQTKRYRGAGLVPANMRIDKGLKQPDRESRMSLRLAVAPPGQCQASSMRTVACIRRVCRDRPEGSEQQGC